MKLYDKEKMKKKELKNLKSQISNGKLDKAIRTLERNRSSFFNSNLENTIINISSNLKTFERDKLQGILTSKESSIISSEITERTLNLINLLEAELETDTQTLSRVKKRRNIKIQPQSVQFIKDAKTPLLVFICFLIILFAFYLDFSDFSLVMSLLVLLVFILFRGIRQLVELLS